MKFKKIKELEDLFGRLPTEITFNILKDEISNIIPINTISSGYNAETKERKYAFILGSLYGFPLDIVAIVKDNQLVSIDFPTDVKKNIESLKNKMLKNL